MMGGLHLINEALKQRKKYIEENIDGIEYISSLIEIKQTGTIYEALCPWHNEKTPSFKIYPKGYIGSNGSPQDHVSGHCFGCSKHFNDIVGFEYLFYDLNTYEDACKSLETKFNLSYTEEDELQLLQKQIDSTEPQHNVSMSLQDINFICSIMCRTYLQGVNDSHPDKLNTELSFIQGIYKKLDHALNECNAIEAKKIIKIIENTLQERQNMIRFNTIKNDRNRLSYKKQ